jgi:hypothetical protein
VRSELASSRGRPPRRRFAMAQLSGRLAIAREVRCNEVAFRVLLKALGNSFQGSERFLFGVSNTVSVRTSKSTRVSLRSAFNLEPTI